MLIDARKKQCPMPVIMVKKAIDEMKTKENIEVIVDNKIALENVSKLASSQGADVNHIEKEGVFHLYLVWSGECKEEVRIDTAKGNDVLDKESILVLSSKYMGVGDHELGELLMKGFLFAITQLDSLPHKVLIYNTGASLSTQNSVSLEDLKTLESRGVEILTCGLCLNHLGLEEKLAVGTVTNMYVIAETMAKATKVIRP